MRPRVFAPDKTMHMMPASRVIDPMEYAARIWEALYPGRPMHFEINGDEFKDYLTNVTAAEGDH